ncbi:MAG: hypothetical protein FJ317_04855 [SAR202 cluster bacterium]|nr:hypothetical protein [SAR202 cluster bacterium]
MKTREFLSELVELVRIQLPSGLRDMRVVGPLFTLVKFHYGDPVVHYEVWIQRRAGLVEVGLHFEGTAERNAKYLAAMSRRAKEITKALGPSVELEQWTASWTRVHEHMPLEALDADTLVAVAHRLAGMIRVLEPMVRGAAV